MQPAEHFPPPHTQGAGSPALAAVSGTEPVLWTFKAAVTKSLGIKSSEAGSKFRLPVNAGAVNFQLTDRTTQPDGISNDHSVPEGAGGTPTRSPPVLTVIS